MAAESNCERTRECFDRMLEAVVDEDVRSAHAHLEHCVDCNRVWIAYRQAAKALPELERIAPSRDLVAGAEEESARSAAARGNSAAWMSLLAVAALAGIVVLLFRNRAPEQRVEVAQVEDSAPQMQLVGIFEADGRRFAVLDAPFLTREALVGDGDTWRGYRVSLREDEVSLERAESDVLRLRAPAAADASALEAKLRAGSLATDDLVRLERLALSGDAGGLRLLETIASTRGPLSERARTALGGDSQALMLGLARMSLDPGNRSRIDTIRSLGRYRSPYSLNALRAIATQSDTQAAVVAVQGLASLRDYPSIPLLKTLSNDGEEEVKSAARRALVQLTQ